MSFKHSGLLNDEVDFWSVSSGEQIQGLMALLFISSDSLIVQELCPFFNCHFVLDHSFEENI